MPAPTGTAGPDRNHRLMNWPPYWTPARQAQCRKGEDDGQCVPHTRAYRANLAPGPSAPAGTVFQTGHGASRTPCSWNSVPVLLPPTAQRTITNPTMADNAEALTGGRQADYMLLSMQYPGPTSPVTSAQTQTSLPSPPTAFGEVPSS